MTFSVSTYEEGFSLPVRLWKRLERNLLWALSGATGRKRHILVELRWRLGDEVMALPIYEALKRVYPDSALTVWCNYPELLENNPYVDAINADVHSVARYILLRKAHRTSYRLDDYAATAGVRTASARPRLYYRDWTCTWTTRIRSLRSTHRAIIALSTGASWQTKQWPLAYWRTLCQDLKQNAYAILHLGTEEPELDVTLNLVGKTDVRTAACVLHESDVYIGCDSGLMHLARAAEVPAIALFGPTRPDILIRNDKDFFPLLAQCACQGCWNSPQDMKPGECLVGDFSCMDTIPPDEVMAVVQTVLERRRS